MHVATVGRVKKQFKWLCISACLLSLVLLVGLKPNLGENFVFHILKKEQEAPGGGNQVVILMWSKYYDQEGDTLMDLILSGRKWDETCCKAVEVTLDRSQLDKATAVVFFSYAGNLRKNDLPATRKPDQLWVLFGKESPKFSPGLRPFNNLFNWTMTYRHDSEIHAPYGEYVERTKEPAGELEVNGKSLSDWISGKTKLLAGVISNCRTPSRREEYIKLLRNETDIPVDIYGACGTPICPRSSSSCSHGTWWKELASTYKFYFAAENSICTDYITEKLWRPLQIGMVPVVYGGGNYTHEAPPGSFIDTRDFLSRRELAEYLRHLDSNPEEYRKYFEWRRKYDIRRGESWQGWCALCKAVQEFRRKVDESPSALSTLSHVYKDLGWWWIYKPSGKGMACWQLKF